jgi:hypothetical protein
MLEQLFTRHEMELICQTKLKTLDVGHNMIEEIENISHLSELEEFWVSTIHCQAD